MSYTSSITGLISSKSKASNRLTASALSLASGRKHTEFGTVANVAEGVAFAQKAAKTRAGITSGQLATSSSAVVQTAMQSVGERLTRLQELASSAQSSTLSADDRVAINAEAQTIVSGIGDIAQTTVNGQNVLQGGTSTYQVGSQTITVDNADLTTVTSSLSGIDLSTQAGATAAMTSIANASTSLTGEMATAAASANVASVAMDVARIELTANEQAEATATGTDYAQESSNYFSGLAQSDAVDLLMAHNGMKKKSILKFFE